MTVGSKIGVGTFGDVYSAVLNGEKVAVKKFLKQKVTDNVMLELRTESAILWYINKRYKLYIID